MKVNTHTAKAFQTMQEQTRIANFELIKSVIARIQAGIGACDPVVNLARA